MNADKITAEFSGNVKHVIAPGIVELLRRNIEPFIEARNGHRIYKITVRVRGTLDPDSPTRGDRITAEIYGNDVDDLSLRIKDFLVRGVDPSSIFIHTVYYSATVRIEDICLPPR